MQVLVPQRFTFISLWTKLCLMSKAQTSSEMKEHSFIRTVRFPNRTPSVKGSVWFQTLHVKVHFVSDPTPIF